MSYSVIRARGTVGIDAPEVTVETHLSHGLPAFNLVGLAETAVRESKERVRSAIINAGFEFPLKRITLNLAPANTPKVGTRFDLAIALGILTASKQVPNNVLENTECIAELALDGGLRPIHKALPAALACARAKRNLLVAEGDALQASLVKNLNILSADSLKSLCESLIENPDLANLKFVSPPDIPKTPSIDHSVADLRDVHGQFKARRALEIAAAGGHNLLMVGPPGTGKTMLAMRLLSILPRMTEEEGFESAKIWSVSHQSFDVNSWRRRPFRAPHHTCSQIALIGGGSNPAPGEVSLAHHGILFLDELPHFQKHALEVLREPLETHEVVVARAAAVNRFPAKFQFVGAMNPCPCGNFGDSRSECICRIDQVDRYLQKISGPLLDRIDIQVEVPRFKQPLHHVDGDTNESSQTVANRVVKARNIQRARQQTLNHHVDNRTLIEMSSLGRQELSFLDKALEKLNLSTRAYFKTIKVARTIADLGGSKQVSREHLAEALGYRCVDRLRASINRLG